MLTHPAEVNTTPWSSETSAPGVSHSSTRKKPPDPAPSITRSASWAAKPIPSGPSRISFGHYNLTRATMSHQHYMDYTTTNCDGVLRSLNRVTAMYRRERSETWISSLSNQSLSIRTSWQSAVGRITRTMTEERGRHVERAVGRIGS